MTIRALASYNRLLWRHGTTIRNACTSSSRGRHVGNVLDTLSSRSLLAQVTAPNSLRKHLEGGEQRALYVGVDPSADSLHVGNLLPLIAALHFIRHGHRVVILIGGATGSIGDPSGRDTERSALSTLELDHNVNRITAQIHDFCSKAGKLLLRRQMIHYKELVGTDQAEQGDQLAESTPMQEAADIGNVEQGETISEMAMNETVSAASSQPASDYRSRTSGTKALLNVTVVNNQSWYQDMNVLSFLRDVGKYGRVGTMLGRDSVKSRMHPSESSSASVGLSFTEFSYQLLQAYDFSILHGAPWNCTVQLGGSDQMGNIMAGVDLIRKQKNVTQDKQQQQVEEKETDESAPAYGLTLPLLTTSSGAKFGKSAGNAVWLSSEKCSDYDFYQFFYRSRDDEVEMYLKTLTMLPIETINDIMHAQQADPSARRAQKILANEVTELVRGRKSVKRAEAASRILFEVHLQGLDAADVLEAFHGDSRLQHIEGGKCIGVDLRQVAVEVGLTKTKSEAKRFIASGGFYINNVPVKNANRILQQSDLICKGRIVVLRIGKTEHRIVSLH
jgi:tyrosyl-tRNA synthetase